MQTKHVSESSLCTEIGGFSIRIKTLLIGLIIIIIIIYQKNEERRHFSPYTDSIFLFYKSTDAKFYFVNEIEHLPAIDGAISNAFVSLPESL